MLDPGHVEELGSRDGLRHHGSHRLAGLQTDGLQGVRAEQGPLQPPGPRLGVQEVGDNRCLPPHLDLVARLDTARLFRLDGGLQVD